jgi:hypothetical protein
VSEANGIDGADLDRCLTTEPETPDPADLLAAVKAATKLTARRIAILAGVNESTLYRGLPAATEGMGAILRAVANPGAHPELAAAIAAQQAIPERRGRKRGAVPYTRPPAGPRVDLPAGTPPDVVAAIRAVARAATRKP